MTGTTPATSRRSRRSRSPTSIKAYAAGAYTTWPAYWLHTYTDYAEQLDQADRGRRRPPIRGSATDRARPGRSAGPRRDGPDPRRAARRGPPRVARGLARPGRRGVRDDGLARRLARRVLAALLGRRAGVRRERGHRRDARAAHAARPVGRGRPRPGRDASCRASPATRWRTPGSWASTPAPRRPSSRHRARRRDRRRRRPCGSPSSAPALATVLVYGIASLGREGATPVKLALAGAAVTAGLIVADHGHRPDQRRRARRAALLAGRVAGRALPAGVPPDRAVHPRRVGRGAGQRSGARTAWPSARTSPSPSASACDGPGSSLFVIVAVLCGAATAACGPIVVRRAASCPTSPGS